jgi:hypothetical protein
MPNMPSLFIPQHMTPPPTTSAQEKERPVAMAAATTPEIGPRGFGPFRESGWGGDSHGIPPQQLIILRQLLSLSSPFAGVYWIVSNVPVALAKTQAQWLAIAVTPLRIVATESMNTFTVSLSTSLIIMIRVMTANAITSHVSHRSKHFKLQDQRAFHLYTWTWSHLSAPSQFFVYHVR